MRQWIYAIAISASLVLPGVVGQANALPVDRFTATAIPSDLEQAQFFLGGQNYCWYDDGWHGPGFYWCGYAFRRGLGWGGGAGWHGWQRGGPGRVGIGGRPGGRPGIGRPGGGRPVGGRPGGGHPGGHRGGGGHPGGGRGHR